MLRKILMIGLFIMLLGVTSHFNMQDEISTAEYDRVNKQEFIKDVQMKCFNGELSSEYCKGY